MRRILFALVLWLAAVPASQSATGLDWIDKNTNLTFYGDLRLRYEVDWHRFGSATQTDSSDFEGHEIRLGYALSSKINVLARLYLVESITTPQDGKRFRVDLNWKFQRAAGSDGSGRSWPTRRGCSSKRPFANARLAAQNRCAVLPAEILHRRAAAAQNL